MIHSAIPCAALASAALAASLYPVLAQAQTVLPSVVVTASRFANDPALVPIGASTITAQEIRAAGIDNVNEAVRRIGGVYGRQATNGTRDFDLDLRGFGANSSQNVAVLVDGVRISENELAAAALSAIAIDSVERIEIVRGGGSVLYGEGATAGVIHVITRRVQGEALRGSVLAEIGSDDLRQARASFARRFGRVAVDASVAGLRTDNYRANNTLHQNNFSGGVEWRDAQGRAGVRVESSRADLRLAGALTLAQFEADPRQTVTPRDFGGNDTDRVTLFLERTYGDWQLAGELSRREKTAGATYDVGFGPSRTVMSSSQTQFSPRVRRLDVFGAMNNEFVAGFDSLRWERTTDSAYSNADATQKSHAVYLRDEIRAGRARLAAGVRHERFDKRSVDPAPFTTATYARRQNENAWEVQGAYALRPALTVFAKAGRSYRMANADENGYTQVANVPLDAQRSRDAEFGATWATQALLATGRVFGHRLRNEIYFDPTAGGGFGANVNLDPTRRTGFELDGKVRLADNLALRGVWQHVHARFTGGPNAQKEMVMAPANNATVRVNWAPLAGHTFDAGVQWADSQRYGGDFANRCGAFIPAYATLDARYGVRLGRWEAALAGGNLTDKRYFTNAYGCKSGIYPSNGRQLKLSARYDF